MKQLLLLLNIGLYLFLAFANISFAQKTESNKVETRVGNPLTSGPAITRTPGNFIYYCQSDPRWTNTCAIGYAGCGPTSMAMVLSNFGEIITPPEMDKIFNQRGWRVCGDNPSLMTTAISVLAKEKGFALHQLAFGGPLNLTEAKRYIDEGYLILGSVSTHIFVVDNVNPANNTVHMQDPARKGCNTPGGYDASNSAPWGGLPWYYAYAIKKK